MKCDYCRQSIEKKLNYHRKIWKKSFFDLYKTTYKHVFIHNWCLELALSENPSAYYLENPVMERKERMLKKVENKKQEWLQKNINITKKK